MLELQITMPAPLPLQYGQYYRIYHPDNNRENIFMQKDDYRYFLKLYAVHVVAYAPNLSI